MKQFFWGYCRFYTLTILSLLGLLPALAAAPVTVKICYESTDNPPYIGSSLDQASAPHPGILVELVDQAVRDSGLTPEFYRSSWQRCKDDLKTGQADTTFAMIWTPNRAEWARFPTDGNGELRANARLWDGIYRVFVSVKSHLTWNGHNFNQLHFGLGAPLGYVAYDKLVTLDAINKHHLDQISGLKQVARKRLDGYVIDQAIGQALLAQQDLLQKVTMLDTPFLETQWYLPVSNAFYQKHPEHAEQIWLQLTRQREQRGPQLLHKYVPDSFSQISLDTHQ